MFITKTTELQEVAARVENRFFDEGNMNFFNSRIGRDVYGGKYFVTSEYGGDSIWDGERRYTIRKFVHMLRSDSETLSISTVGEFGGYATAAAARKEIKRMLEEEND